MQNCGQNDGSRMLDLEIVLAISELRKLGNPNNTAPSQDLF